MEGSVEQPGHMERWLSRNRFVLIKPRTALQPITGPSKGEPDKPV